VRILIEAAVETLEGSVEAVREGAGRLELCADLATGGLTPDPELIRAVRAAVHVPVSVMIRPRPGDFIYRPEERRAMLDQIQLAKAAGAQGLVFGVLTAAGLIDEGWTVRLTAAARPLSVTFHRAVDATPDLLASVEALARLGVNRVLTSGGAPSAEQGLRQLGRLVHQFGRRIGILPGGRVRAENAGQIVRRLGVSEIHVGYPTGAETGRIAAVRLVLGGRVETP
jgi:copper homeostasis protein